MKRLSVLVFILILNACAQDNLEEQQSNDITKNGELILAVGGEADEGFDPTTGWGMYGSPLFQSTLLKYDKDFNIENDLATEYHVSEDGLSYTVELREDAVFSDQEALTSEDVAFTFKTAKDSGSIIDLSNLNKVETPDDHTLVFTLHEPQSTFITHLITMGIVPEHAYDESYNENPMGSGPYQLVQWNKGQQLIVEKNPYYYGEQPEFKKLTFLFLEEDAAYAAAVSGEADVVSITPGYADQHVPGMKMVAIDSVDNRGIMFPFEESGGETESGAPIGNDVTADITIRQAIDIAVDREAMADGVLNGYGIPAYSVADRLPWWNAETSVDDNRLDEAKSMLDDAGWQENSEGIREKGGLTAEFTILYPAGDEIRQSLSMVAADQIEALGIKVGTEGQSWNDLERTMHSNPVMMGWGSHDPLEMYNIYSSDTQGEGYYNANYYSNSTVDDHMDAAMHATTQEEANEHWKKAQWDGETGFSSSGDVPWVWLVNLQHLYLVDEDLDIGAQKLHPHGHGWPITDNIEEWQWTE